MSANRTLLDGRYTRGFYVGHSVPRYPFQQNGDTRALIVSREWRQHVGTYAPGQIGVERDPKFADAFLVAESEPRPTNIGGVIATTRTFARVPADQIEYGSRVITKPDAGSVGTRRDTNADKVYSNSGLTTFYAFATYANHKFVDNGKVYGPIAATTSANSGGNTRVTWTAHGLAGTEEIIVASSFASNAENWVVFASGAYSVVDANTIDLTGVNYGTAAVFCAEYLRTYTPGTDRVGLRLTTKFYLPGFTSGITTPADIPLPTLLLNDAELLTSILTNLTGYQTYDASALERWQDGWPIYMQTLEEINMANV